MYSAETPTRHSGFNFWKYHFWLPLIFSVVTLFMFEYFLFDLDFADYIYRLLGGDWFLRYNWFLYGVMHHRGKQLLIIFGLLVLSLYAASYKIDALKRWRWSLGFSLLAMILIPAIVTELKHLSSVPCPWNLTRYGGTEPYLHNSQYPLSMSTKGCFPAGHASGGYGLLALYFGFLPVLTKRKYLLLIPGLLVGLSFGLAQQVRGAHFISHDLWTLSICWFGNLFLFKLSLLLNPPGNNQQVGYRLTADGVL